MKFHMQPQSIVEGSPENSPALLLSVTNDTFPASSFLNWNSYRNKRQIVSRISQSILLSSLYLSSLKSATSDSTIRYNGAIGYEAAASAFSPGQTLRSVPLLPQSALLNSIPIRNELIGQLQAYFESFVQLISPLPTQRIQIAKNTSILWTNLRINAQRAAGIFIYNKKDLLPRLNASDAYNAPDVFIKTTELADYTLKKLQVDALRLVNSSSRSQVSECLRAMQRCLNGLCEIAYLMSDPLSTRSRKDPDWLYDTMAGMDRRVNVTDNIIGASVFDRLSVYRKKISMADDSSKYKALPRLQGRTIVTLSFQRPGPARIMTRPSDSKVSNSLDFVLSNIQRYSDNNEQEKVRIVVDGINHPYTAGNFIDLCLKGFYSDIPVKQDSFDEFDGLSQRQNSSSSKRVIFGDYREGYVDPITNSQRRVPLEILRSYSGGKRFTVTGAARNSAVFDPPPPVQSFATYGAIGMLHNRGDNNGASTAFFWLPADSTQTLLERNSRALFSTLNNQFSLFAYAIEGNDVLENLKPGDILVSAVVEDGVWRLEEPDFLDDILNS